MIIAIDDSGDPGLKLGKGSSDYFVIAAILFTDDLDAEEAALKIKRLRQKLGWKPRHEFKFRKTSPWVRQLFLNEIKSCNFEVSLVIIDKKDYEGEKLFKNDASKLYNAVILKSMKGFTVSLKQVHIIVDGESGSSYRRKVKTFFRKNLSKQAIRELSYRDSADDNLVQLADMVAGAAHRSTGQDKDLSDIKIVRKHIVRIETSI